MVHCLDIDSDLVITFLRTHVCVATNTDEDKQAIGIRAWSLFHEVWEIPHCYSFQDFTGVARPYKLVWKVKYGDCIAVVRHVRLHHALHAFNITPRSSSVHSIVCLVLVDRVVRLINHQIAKVAFCDLQIQHQENILLLLCFALTTAEVTIPRQLGYRQSVCR